MLYWKSFIFNAIDFVLALQSNDTAQQLIANAIYENQPIESEVQRQTYSVKKLLQTNII